MRRFNRLPGVSYGRGRQEDRLLWFWSGGAYTDSSGALSEEGGLCFYPARRRERPGVCSKAGGCLGGWFRQNAAGAP